MTAPRYVPGLTPLLELRLRIGYERALHADAPGGTRSAYPVEGGEFEGARLRGTVEPVGMDWVRWRSDGVMEIDMRTMLRTDDGALIALSYHGLAVVGDDPAALAAARDFDRSAASARTVAFARTSPRFETDAPEYAWLNRVQAVAKGRRDAEGPHYSVFEVD